MDEEIKQVANDAVNIGIQEFTENINHIMQETDISIDEVKYNARLFQSAYELYITLKERITIELNGKKRILPNMKIQLQQLQDKAYDAFFNFQNSFNQFFKQKIQMLAIITINDENGAHRELRLMDNSFDELIRNQYGGLVYNFEQLGQRLVWAKDDYDATLLELVTDEVLFRWDVSINTHHSSQYLPILWYLNGKWSGAMVTNKGSINEAYANFYINKFTGFKQNNMESNVQTYVLNDTYGIRSVDNKSGFAIGDVQYNGVQFAVKSINASPMAMTQVYKEIPNLLKMINNELERTPNIMMANLPNSLKKATAHQAKEMLAEDLKNALNTIFEQSGFTY